MRTMRSDGVSGLSWKSCPAFSEISGALQLDLNVEERMEKACARFA